MVRENEKQDATHSGAIINSQPVRTTEKGASRLDAGKKAPGRKRHTIVEYRRAALLAVVIDAANFQSLPRAATRG